MGEREQKKKKENSYCILIWQMKVTEECKKQFSAYKERFVPFSDSSSRDVLPSWNTPVPKWTVYCSGVCV